MDAKIEQALNEQIQAEFYSFYLYLSVSAWFTAQHLDGFAHWMRAQAHEEFAHAMKLYDYVNERGGPAELLAIDKPATEWGSAAAAVKDVLDHERHITARINQLVNLANQANDHATTVILHWYVTEQVEEESTAETLYHQVKMVDQSPHGLLMIDRELAARPMPEVASTADEA